MEVHDVSFSYERNNPLFENISASVRSGKVTTIIGPNGSGKSTLLSIMARRLSPDQGELLIDGKTLRSYTPKQLAQQMAVVYQQNEAPGDMTVRKLVAYGRFPYRKRFSTSTNVDEQAIHKALSVTNLLEKADMPLQSLSGGEQQRVWIALALAQETKYLLLDEPTTYLDLYHQLETLELVRTLNEQKQMTIVMVLHELNQAIQYSDDLIVMDKGQIIRAGKPRDVLTEQLIKDIYKVNAVLREDEDAGLILLPIGV